jgi:hypothetical protein
MEVVGRSVVSIGKVEPSSPQPVVHQSFGRAGSIYGSVAHPQTNTHTTTVS